MATTGAPLVRSIFFHPRQQRIVGKPFFSHIGHIHHRFHRKQTQGLQQGALRRIEFQGASRPPLIQTGGHLHQQLA